MAQAMHAQAITRYFPNRSPTGPKNSCDKPYATENEVMTAAACPSDTSNPLANIGSNASVKRREMPLANAAIDSARKAAPGMDVESETTGGSLVSFKGTPLPAVSLEAGS